MKKQGKKILLVILALVVILGVGVGIYVSDYYKAGETAKAIEKNLDVVKKDGKWLSLEEKENKVGLIFYPGAKVEHSAYLPLMQMLSEEGIQCYLVEMPFHLAILGKDQADEVRKAHPEIKKWYIGGHSMGGAFASAYASEHQEDIEGVILLGAYLYGDYPVERSITIYGSEDKVLNRDKIDYDENVHVISGGNHAQFGDYGEQKGDGTATIAPKEQWRQTAELIGEFMKE